MNPWITDLRYAQTTQRAVEVTLLTGEKFLAGVRAVSEEDGFVTLHRPQTMQDETTTQRVALDLIGALTVTDIEWT